MTNKLVIIINSLKVPKIKKILLYEMKFLVPNYSCLQIRGLPPSDPQSLCPLSSTEFVEPPPRKNPGYATDTIQYGFILLSFNGAFSSPGDVLSNGRMLNESVNGLEYVMC